MGTYAYHDGECDDLPYTSNDVLIAKEPKLFLENCGTVACALGHAPAAGIKPHEDEFLWSTPWGKEKPEPVGFSWYAYGRRVFGVDNEDFDNFSFLFAGTWDLYDGHHYGAAARIHYLLAGGDVTEWWVNPDFAKKYAPYRKGSRSKIRREIDSVR